MTQQEVHTKVEKLINAYSYLGEVTDVWLHPDIMVILDTRSNAMSILLSPYRIGKVYVTANGEFNDVSDVRIAFQTKFCFEEESEIESSCND